MNTKVSLPAVIAMGVVGGIFGIFAARFLPGWVILLILLAVIGLVGFALANLRSNRAVVAASPAERDAALSGPPPAGQARLLVYRQGFVGKALGVDVTLDGAVVAQLKSPRFTALDVTPGRHVVGTRFGGTAKMQNRDAALDVDAAAGETVTVRMTFDMTLGKNQITLKTVSTAEALPALRTMTMVTPDGAPLAPARVV